MLTPEQLKNLPVSISQQYTELADFILRDICRRISEAGKITDTAEYQIYRAKALGLSNKEIRNKIAEINGVSEKEVNKLFRSTAKTSDEFDRKVFKQPEDAGTPLEDNKVLQQVITAQAKQTNETFENITGTMGFAEKRDGQVVYSSLTDTLRKEMDAAHLKITSGATDYITAIRAATKKLSDSGVRTIYYESGRSDRVDVAVRRAVITGTSQVVQKISEQNGEQFGADGWEISAHAGARPSHAIYQGKQYPNSQYETIVRPLVEDYNCRHSAYPIILGVSEPTYTEEQLRNIDPPPFVYDGKKYTAYEATQQQRKMERVMRKQKDLCIASDAAGDKDGFTTAAIKLRRQNEIYKDFSEKAGLYTQYERTQVQGFNRSISSKAMWAVKKAEEMDKNQLTFTGNSGIIQLNRKLDRRDKNIGAFTDLKIPMQKRSVLTICNKYGVNTKGLTIKIQRSEKLLALPYFGSTDYDNIGRIDLFPNAFADEEQLLKTVIHEKCHVMQLRKYGKKHAQENIDLMEKQAERFERLYYAILRKEHRK